MRFQIQCIVIVVHSLLHIDGLAFDRAIHRRTQRSTSFVSDISAAPTKCPFTSLTKWLRIPQSDNNDLPVSKNGIYVHYNQVSHFKNTVAVDPITYDGSPLSEEISGSNLWKTRYAMAAEVVYKKALALKCPFFRRRATDILEFTDNTIRKLYGNAIASFGYPLELRGIDNAGAKRVGLTMEEIMDVIRNDWKIENNKGYYVTGRLTTNIYKDDCLFDGPDPDMPVRGIRKYVNAASQLFEYKTSTSELLSLNINNNTVVATWRFNGTMRLPWRPKLPEVTGSTTYYVDESGLIYKHCETWDISALQAFLRTFFPKLSEKMYVQQH